ncbi:ComEC/Rec2 family competence protein [Taklimakanibacter deserti]|uniref:ComEC/Rec2 family competence protein n=1 Tax=Taklimakanibacter deserti TaxID=2267839 RepID=UPI000E64FE3C
MADWVQGTVAEEGTERAPWRDKARAILAAQRGNFFLWSPVWLMAGIAIYFALPREPPPLAFAVIAAILALLVFSAQAKRSAAARILLLALIGFCLIKARTEWVSAPMLRAPTGEALLTGVVEDFERRGAKRAVAILRIVELTGKGVTRIPARARVTMTGATPLRPGQMITAKAQLFPLPTPVVPGGYDYGRGLWFDGIGATGRLYGEVAMAGTDPSWRLRFRAGLEALRETIGERIRAVLPSGRSGVAEAMITGERGTIPREVNDSLQASGLAHILSISGLHMSLVAGFTFWLVRALLALSPTLATLYPIKKWAAIAGLATGFVYMMMASASVATQRSYIMLAVMFIAILVDRPGLSMRNLAIAALIILIISPEAALTASLQMSFLAVMGLLAFYEVWSGWLARGEGNDQGVIHRAATFIWRAFCAAAFTSLAAGGMSSIAAAYHFGRLSPYGLIANLLALPAMSVVMTAGMTSVLVMPFGLETLPLHVMDMGLLWVQSVSDWVVSLPGAQGRIPALPLAPALLLTLAGVVLCLAKGFVRLVALPIAGIALFAATFVHGPDIYVDPEAKNVAVRNDSGDLVPAQPRRGRFAVSQWLRVDGDGATPTQAAHRTGWICEGSVCRAAVRGQRLLYLSEEKLVMTIPCGEADILIAAFPLRGRCRSVPLRIDRFSVWRMGAHALYVDGGAVRVETARGLQGLRPWTITPEPRRKDTSRGKGQGAQLRP